MLIGEPRLLRPACPRPNHRPGRHSRRARRGHRACTDTERSVGKVKTGPARLRAEVKPSARSSPPELASAVGPTEIALAPPTRPAPTEPPPLAPAAAHPVGVPSDAHPDLAAQHAAAQPDSITGRNHWRSSPRCSRIRRATQKFAPAAKEGEEGSRLACRSVAGDIGCTNLGLSPDEKCRAGPASLGVRRNPCVPVSDRRSKVAGKNHADSSVGVDAGPGAGRPGSWLCTIQAPVKPADRAG